MAVLLSCMFDTVVFNRIVDGVVPVDALKDRVQAHATHIQRDEIANTPDPSRRQALEGIFGTITGSAVPTASFVLDVSRLDEAGFGGSRIVPTNSVVWEVSAWDQANWSAEDNLYVPIKADLDSLNRGKKNNTHDALIAETSVKGGYILVTDDRDLVTVTKKYRGECLSVLELWQRINEAAT